jgi:tetratricopeptide (TPR) repeat protein
MMRRKYLNRILTFVAVIVFLSSSLIYAGEDPRTRIDFWQNNYNELLPGDDFRAARAHDIFNRVLNAAGKRPGVVPRLFIVKNESPNIPLAIAIPDGGIIISKRVLDICYKDVKRGDHRLAFVLAHEIAHQLKDDFWHMKFFQAVELSREENPQNKEVLEEVRDIAGMSDKVLAKELQADEHGIVYASMAGFKTNAIITEDHQVNFFAYFYQSLHPGNIKGFPEDTKHPTPGQRAEVVKARLKQVLDMVELFDLGVLFYKAGDYRKAILLFREFLRFFPSREVYHNLASSHHQLALEFFRDWQKDKKGIPFKLSIALDPETLAGKIILRSSSKEGPAELFNKHIKKAIEYYKTAITHDPSYLLSYNNLGCALIIKGEVYEAIAMIKKAIKIKPGFAPALNNLGAAFYLVENPDKAKENLLNAAELDPKYDAPLFNLGIIAHKDKNEDEAKKHWMAYLELDPDSGWAGSIRKTLAPGKPGEARKSASPGDFENITGLEIGDYEEDVPPGWGKPVKKRKISLEEEPFRVSIYKNGVKTLSQDDEIKLILIPGSYNGKSVKGISIGSPGKDVLAKYGRASRILRMTAGDTWVYSPGRIVFTVREDKVVSWLLF